MTTQQKKATKTALKASKARRAATKTATLPSTRRTRQTAATKLTKPEDKIAMKRVDRAIRKIETGEVTPRRRRSGAYAASEPQVTVPEKSVFEIDPSSFMKGLVAGFVISSLFIIVGWFARS